MTTTDKSDNWLIELLKRFGFSRYRWFRKWHGGHWYWFVNFHTYVCNQHRPEYKDKCFVGNGFAWVLDHEHWGVACPESLRDYWPVDELFSV